MKFEFKFEFHRYRPVSVQTGPVYRYRTAPVWPDRSVSKTLDTTGLASGGGSRSWLEWTVSSPDSTSTTEGSEFRRVRPQLPPPGISSVHPSCSVTVSLGRTEFSHGHARTSSDRARCLLTCADIGSLARLTGPETRYRLGAC